jgi:ribosomal protein S18 acetylase RimI-like enzyme
METKAGRQRPGVTRTAVRTYLELRARTELRPRRISDAAVRVDRVKPCAPALWRALYEGVGGAYHWVDRLPWTDAQIREYLDDPSVSLFVLTVEGTVAGYFELKRYDDHSVEIAYFGLLPAYFGRGLGGYLLTEAAERAWELSPSRVWVHTSTLDHPAALSNYLARGFTIYRREEYEVPSI